MKKKKLLKQVAVVGSIQLLTFSQVNVPALAEVLDASEETKHTYQSEEKDDELVPAAEPVVATEAVTTTSETLPDEPVEAVAVDEAVNNMSNEEAEQTDKPLATFAGVDLSGTNDQFSSNNYHSSAQAKTLSINAAFDASSATSSRKIKIELANGLGFSTLPGMVAKNDNKNDWRFDASSLPAQLKGVISNATYLPNDTIQGVVQPKAGTIIYECSPGTSLLSLSLGIISDRALNTTLSELTLTDSIRVTTLANETVTQSETLESYTLVGIVYPVLYAGSSPQSIALNAGETGSVKKFFYEQNNVTSLLSWGYTFADKLTYTFKADKRAGLTAVSYPADPSAVAVTIDRTSDPAYDFVSVTLESVYLKYGNNLQFDYQAAEDATAGTYYVTLESAEVTANGTTFADTSHWTSTRQEINVVSEANIKLSTPSNPYYAYDPTITDTQLTTLGGFTLSNVGSESEAQQLRVTFDDPTIGVRMLSLPYEENGKLTDLTVKTNKGQTFEIAEATGTNMQTRYGFGRYQLTLKNLGAVAADEYITEVTYTMGKIKSGANCFAQFRGSENMNTGSNYALPLAYYGELVNIPPAKTYEATATIVAADKEFDDESATAVTNKMNIVEAGYTTFYTGTNINGSTQFLSGSLQTITANLKLVEYPYATTSPSLVKGFDVYIRAGEYLKVNVDSISITYEGAQLSVADGSLVAVPSVDNTGNPVYKLELPDVILGKAKPDSFTAYSALALKYEVKVKSDAPTTYIPGNELVQIMPKNLKVPVGNGGNVNFNNPDIYDVNGNGDTTEYMGTLNKTIGIQLIEQKDFTVTTAANLNDGAWVRYDYDTNSEIIDLNPSGSAKYQLTVSNSSGNDVSGYTALIPIPKAGEKTDLTPATPEAFNPSEHLQKEAFTWTASLLDEIVSTGTLNYQFFYATSYETDKNSTNFKAWRDIDDKNEIRMVKVVTTDTVPDEFTEAITFPLSLTDEDADLHAGNVNIYSARVYREILGTAGYKPSEPIAIRLKTGVIKGQAFVDANRNGRKDSEESGLNGVTVLAYEAGSNRTNLLASTVTKTIDNQDGRYEFMGLDKGQAVDIVFVNPSTDDSLRFAPTTENGSTPTTDADYLQAQTSAVTPSGTNFEKIDAGFIEPVTITFDAGKGSTAATELKKYPNEKITTEPQAIQEGTVFNGWYDAKTGGNKVAFPYTVTNEEQTFYAQYTANTYTVTYKVEGTVATTAQVEFDSLLTKPTNPTKIGHTFTGWYDAETDGNEWHFATDKMPPSHLTLYAQFARNSYQLHFDNDGDVTTQTVAYEALATEPTAPSKTGYDFIGWYDAPTGGSQWDFASKKMPAQDQTLYARYQVKAYTVDFQVAGTSVAQTTVNYGSLLTAPTEPTQTGHQFAGWYDDQGNEWLFDQQTMPAQNLTLTAHFVANRYTLSFNNEGRVTEQSVAYNQLAQEPTPPTKVGYTFIGWYDAQIGGQQWDFAIDKMAAADKMLYARYRINQYNVTFDNQGTQETLTATYDTLITPPENPSKLGYTFAGWYETSSNIHWNFSVDRVPAQNITLVARFTADNQTITFDINGGNPASQPLDIVAPTDSHVDLDRQIPEKAGYQFVGWFAGEKQMSGTILMPVGGLQLVARWTAAQQVIRFDTNGGSGLDSLAVATDSTINLDEYQTIRAGYQFLGWYDAQEQLVQGNYVVPAGGAVLTAKWQAQEQTLTFDTDGGTPVTEIVAPTDTLIDLDEIEQPTKEGYDFIGWFDETEQLVSGTIAMPAGGLHLVARWQVAETPKTWRIEATNFSMTLTELQAANKQNTLEAEILTRSGAKAWIEETEELLNPIQVSTENLIEAAGKYEVKVYYREEVIEPLMARSLAKVSPEVVEVAETIEVEIKTDSSASPTVPSNTQKPQIASSAKTSTTGLPKAGETSSLSVFWLGLLAVGTSSWYFFKRLWRKN